MHELYVFCVSEHLMCDIDCDIEVIQQEVEVKTAPPRKHKGRFKTWEKTTAKI